MNSEITDKSKIKGWVLFDGDCPLCTNTVRRFARALQRRGFAVLPLQTPWVKEKLVDSGDLLTEMRLLLPDGTTYGGADAMVQLARSFWWARPLYWASFLLGSMAVLRKTYAWVAHHRHCVMACRVPKRKKTKRVFFEMP